MSARASNRPTSASTRMTGSGTVFSLRENPTVSASVSENQRRQEAAGRRQEAAGRRVGSRVPLFGRGQASLGEGKPLWARASLFGRGQASPLHDAHAVCVGARLALALTKKGVVLSAACCLLPHMLS